MKRFIKSFTEDIDWRENDKKTLQKTSFILKKLILFLQEEFSQEIFFDIKNFYEDFYSEYHE